MNDANKGRVEAKSASMGVAKSRRFQQNRRDRKHQLGQIRENKKAKILEAKRSIGGPGRFSSPLLTVIINLNENDDVTSNWVINKLVSCDESAVTVSTSPKNEDTQNQSCITHLSFPRFKRRFAFITPDRNNLHAVLDATKVSDSVIFLLSTNGCGEIENISDGDSTGMKIFSAVISQGIPADPIFLLTNQSMEDAEKIDELNTKSLKNQELCHFKHAIREKCISGDFSLPMSPTLDLKLYITSTTYEHFGEKKEGFLLEDV